MDGPPADSKFEKGDALWLGIPLLLMFGLGVAKSYILGPLKGEYWREILPVTGYARSGPSGSFPKSLPSSTFWQWLWEVHPNAVTGLWVLSFLGLAIGCVALWRFRHRKGIGNLARGALVGATATTSFLWAIM